VVERAAILAEGADSTEVLAWITAHDGVPEELPPQSTGGGLHGARRHGSGDADLRTPLRFVLPSDAIS
jgi:hypothetical protein